MSVVREFSRLDQLIAYATTHSACLFTFRRLKDAFGIDVEAAQQYFSHLTDAFFAFAVPRYHPSIVARVRDPQKLYVIDTGIRNAMSR